MAQAKTLTFGKGAIFVSDMATPTPEFVAPCGFEQLTMTIEIATNESNIPDCADPDLPAWLASDIVSKQMRLSGEGLLDTDAYQIWRDWVVNNVPAQEVPVRWVIDAPAAAGGGYYEAPAIVAAYSEQGQRGQRWRVSVELRLNGKPTFTAATT